MFINSKFIKILFLRKKSKIKYIKIVTLETLASNPLDPIFLGYMAENNFEVSLKCYDKLIDDNNKNKNN